MHEEWTDKLSDYLDGELPDAERYAVESHLSGCADCAAVLTDMKRVVAHARGLEPRPPQADLWRGIAARIDTAATRRRVSFTLPELAAAAVLLIAISGGVAWQTAERLRGDDRSADLPPSRDASADGRTVGGGGQVRRDVTLPGQTSTPADDIQIATVSFADPQYDAAVADLEKAVKQGRGRLDANTISIVEHNLQIIDQAIEQARQALAADPANSYLNSHFFETRRRKLDLLRRAAALTTESN